MKKNNGIYIIAGLLSLTVPLATLSDVTTPPYWPSPYVAEGWSAQHHDAHNSDWMPLNIGDFSTNNGDLGVIDMMLQDTNNPVVCSGGGITGKLDGKDYFIVTTGKIKYPNLHVLDIQDGHLYWQAAPPSTNAPAGSQPGPGACALTICPSLDKYGFIYLADCHYLYKYSLAATPDANGYQPWLEREPMPNLKTYNSTNGLWEPKAPTTPVDDSNTKAFPFMSFVMSPEVSNHFYVGGFTVQGETFMFDSADLSCVASNYLETNMIGSVTGAPPCDPYAFAATNNPMEYSTNNPIILGIWASGETNTTDPDVKYFMNPCQLKAYMDAGTMGTGVMIANNPCMMINPTNPAACTLFIAGGQSSYLEQWDPTPTGKDAFVYRVDFDPTQAEPTNRLVIQNYVITNTVLGRPQFNFHGRMLNGTNTATSPDLSANEQWLFCGDKAGYSYNFSTAHGEFIWKVHTGGALGSPTTFQNPNDEHQFLYMTLCDYEPWIFMIDETTGGIVSNATYGLMTNRLEFSDYITQNHWRTEPGYNQTYTNTHGVFERNAIGASIILGASNKVEVVYTVGWKFPSQPEVIQNMTTIPTHLEVLFLDITKFWTATNAADIVVASFMDTTSSSEAGYIINPESTSNGVMLYLSQSSCMGQFLALNSAQGHFVADHTRLFIPEGMRDLVMPATGGLGLLSLPFYEKKVLNDFDGDGKADIGCYYPTTGEWFIFLSGSESLWTTTYGGGDESKPISGFFGTGNRCDYGTYYAPSGLWQIHFSAGGGRTNNFGFPGTTPVTGDFDGDGTTDFGCYYPPDGGWFIFKSKTESLWTTSFGFPGTSPVTGDFDGDGIADFGCYYPPDGGWFIFKSKTQKLWTTNFGFAGTSPIAGDFDGDGIADFGCYYPPDGSWFIFKSKTESLWTTNFGFLGTTPVVGDYDGDGIDDFGCYYPPNGGWYIYKSTTGLWTTQFGYEGTIAIQ